MERLTLSQMRRNQPWIPADAGIRNRTFYDRIRDAKDALGRKIAPLLGLDFDEMAKDESKGILRQMLVYHGSPHTFEKFDASKIGTGEGAQAYGHGLYFAESPETAGFYKNALTARRAEFLHNGSPIDEADVEDAITDAIRKSGGNPYEARGLAKDAINERLSGKPASNKEAAAIMDRYQLSKPEGGLYQADIPDEHISKMLDWDKPLSEQSPEIQKALGYVGRDFDAEERLFAKAKRLGVKPQSLPEYKQLESQMDAAFDADMPGWKIYKELESQRGAGPFVHQGPKGASEYLNSLGIKGIKYLDQGSRAAGQGTRNFVVFDPEILRGVTRK